ncbi:MAG: hypothetical protein U1E65_18785 [Myxococcota bacterium]
MSTMAILLAAAASALLLGAGYLFAARNQARLRHDLRLRLDAAQDKLRRLERERSPSNVNAKVLKAEIVSAVKPLLDREVKAQEGLEDRLSGAVESQLASLLRPLLDREKMGSALVGLNAGTEHAHSLMDVLDAVARSGSFTTVLVSDEVGLPLATNRAGRDPEIHAGMASLLLTLFDRVASNDQPRPLAAVFRDEANRLILHRVFKAQGTRFVLTAVSMGMPVSPEALDPALASIERMLNRQAWAAEEA